MRYMHINNLYKDQDVLFFKEVYALEKVHGTSAHISYDASEDKLHFYSGGMSQNLFMDIFDKDDLHARFRELGHHKVVIYGEAYGGSQQRMGNTYGKQPRFIAFDVRIQPTLDGSHNSWLNVPNAEQITHRLGLQFVPYEVGPTTIEWLNSQRDADSTVAILNGMGPGHKREGIVIRPLIEITKSNGNRIIAKHKRDDFSETRTPREVDPAALKVLEDAEAVAFEWVTQMRLEHVLDKIPLPHDMSTTPRVIAAMTKDVLREGEEEFIDSKVVRKAIGAAASKLYKAYVSQIPQGQE